jgi:hypothetical protein
LAIPQREGHGTLIEVNPDEFAKWFTNRVNRVELCGKLGEGISFRPRVYNILAFNMPLKMEPGNPIHRAEVNEANKHNLSSKVVQTNKSKNSKPEDGTPGTLVKHIQRQLIDQSQMAF